VIVNFLGASLVYALLHTFIHQPWSVTKKLLGKNHGSDVEFHLSAAGALAFKACQYRQFALIKTIFDAIAPEHLQDAVEVALHGPFSMDATYNFIPMYKLCIMNDPEKYFTVEMFRIMERAYRSSMVNKKETYRLNVSPHLEHPFAESHIFAKALNLLLSDKTCPFSLIDLMDMAGVSDIPALKQYLTEDSQKRFLGHYGVKITDDLESAWSKIALKRKDRHEEWYKRHAIPILLKLQALDNLLVPTLYPIIAEYAAT
jgi:hypothetical protein